MMNLAPAVVRLPAQPLDWMGKTVEFLHSDPEYRQFFPRQARRVVSVVINESGSFELGFGDTDGAVDFQGLEAIEVLSVSP